MDPRALFIQVVKGPRPKAFFHRRRDVLGAAQQTFTSATAGSTTGSGERRVASAIASSTRVVP